MVGFGPWGTLAEDRAGERGPTGSFSAGSLLAGCTLCARLALGDEGQPDSCLHPYSSRGIITLCQTHLLLLPLPQAEAALHSVSLDAMEGREEITW